MNIEIERRWLLPQSTLALLPSVDAVSIVQGYLNPAGPDTVRVRVEKDTDSTFGNAMLCVKRKTEGLGKIEIETPIDSQAAMEMLRGCPQLEKKRLHMPLLTSLHTCTAMMFRNQFLYVDIDAFYDPYFGLVIAEVEFPDESMADMFVAPEWFGKEITDLPLSNKKLALRDPKALRALKKLGFNFPGE